MIDTELRKNERNRGYFFHKMPRVGASKVKQAALRDITKECGNGKLFNQNYLFSEKLVLDSVWFDFEYFPI